MPHHEQQPAFDDVWSVEGRFMHFVYSPKGGVEGVLIDTDGIPTQFVFDAKGEGVPPPFSNIRPGQAVVIEGIESAPSPKGQAAHTVYRFERLASVDGAPSQAPDENGVVDGRVVRFNHARHGEANGVVLDSGDFVHLRPGGFAQLDLKVGDAIRAHGRVRPLATGDGCVVEAEQVNGIALG